VIVNAPPGDSGNGAPLCFVPQFHDQRIAFIIPPTPEQKFPSAVRAGHRNGESLSSKLDLDIPGARGNDAHDCSVRQPERKPISARAMLHLDHAARPVFFLSAFHRAILAQRVGQKLSNLNLAEVPGACPPRPESWQSHCPPAEPLFCAEGGVHRILADFLLDLD